jgi:2-polyprenyl-3-methyl-5-hydroxy-6-metoxy-1,4-benzoquinol methylase
MDLVSQNYWDSSYNNFDYHIPSDEVTNWIDRFNKSLLQTGNNNVFELGCFPGRYLSYIGKKGWTVNGMDLTPRMETDFATWLQSIQVQTGLLTAGDVLEYAKTTSDKYDMVCSFGFIEHFENFDEIIRLHDAIVKPGGYLMITTPNFRGGVQKFLHSTLDAENLARHYLPSMKPFLWKSQLESMGYEVQFAGYFGNFDFWNDAQERNALQKFSLKAIRKIKPLLKQLPDNAAYSPYCGIFAQKK